MLFDWAKSPQFIKSQWMCLMRGDSFTQCQHCELKKCTGLETFIFGCPTLFPVFPLVLTDAGGCWGKDRWSLTHNTNCTWILTKLFFYYCPSQTAPSTLPQCATLSSSLSLSHSLTHTHIHTHTQAPLWHPDDIQMCQALSSLWLVCEWACVRV